MNDLPSVSIVLPVYNEERFISACLDSIYSQTYPKEKMEIIIADGGSTDRTAAIIQKDFSKYSNLRVIHNERRTQPAGFNTGVAAANGSVIIRMDAHALYDKDYVMNSVNRLLEDNRIGNTGGMCSIQTKVNTNTAKLICIINQSRFGTGGAAFRSGGKEGPVETVPFGCFWHSILNKIGPMNEMIPRAEDIEFNRRIIKAGYIVYFDPSIRSTYFARNDLRSSLKQMYYNGVSIGYLLRHARFDVCSIRHLVPFLFVSSLVFFWFLIFINHLFVCLPLFIFLSYLTLDFYFSALYVKQTGWRSFCKLMLFFFLHHVAYGLGTWHGLFSLRTSNAKNVHPNK